MMQRHQILINPSFSSQTSSINSSLTTVGGYQVNNVQGLGGGIVNSSNVRAFLNNDVNEFIINDFFSYLTGSTTTIEFAEIYHSDQKLSDVFNNYYVSSVLNNQVPSTSIIDNSLTGTSGTTIIENSVYQYNGVAPEKGLDNIPLSIDGGDRILKVYSALTTYTTEESYYIPVFIPRNNKQMARLKFQACENSVSIFVNSGPMTFNGNSNLFGSSELLSGSTEASLNTSDGEIAIKDSSSIPNSKIIIDVGGFTITSI